MPRKIYAWTSQTTTWKVPDDWNDSNNIIMAIGRGGNTTANALGAGGGGAFAEIENLTLTPRQTVYLGTTDTGTTGVWLNKTSNAKPTATSDGVFAADGKNATTTTGGAGGLNTDCIGTITFSGGNGGNGNGTLVTGGGGGGAAGPSGAGKNGGAGDTTAQGDDGGGGGGGAGGGSSTVGGAGTTAGGAGGQGPNGVGSGAGGAAGAGGAGTAGGGGGGGDQTQPGGAGGAGQDIGIVTDSEADGIAVGTNIGAGGGEGGDGGLYATTSSSAPGNYGGGAGGGATTTSGAVGLVVIIYEPKVLGRLWLWGNNPTGALGTNDITPRSSPVQTVSGGTNWINTSASSGLNNNNRFSAGIKDDNTLWLWGSNVSGQLGNGNTTNTSSPVQTVAGGTDWRYVTLGDDHAAALKTDNSLWLWGSNTNGQLGDNSRTNRSSPVQTVSLGTNWRDVASGGNHIAAIKTDGTLWTWGFNFNGQLGDNSTAAKSSPVQTVSGGINWAQVSAGGAATAGIKTDGTLWLWGSNSLGALGDNSTIQKSSPVQTVSGGTNWRYVNTGGQHTGAIKIDGTLWMWGRNDYGQIGDNTSGNTSTLTNQRSSPVQTIAGGTDWKSVSCTSLVNTAAIKTDGTLWVWGSNLDGRLGTNEPGATAGSSLNAKSSPVQTVSGGGNWLDVSIGGDKTSAIRAAILAAVTGNMFMLF